MPEYPEQFIQKTITRYDRIKIRVNTILNTYPNENRDARTVKYILAIFILINTISVVISTIPDLPLSFRYQLFAIISICLTVFAIEYILRLWSCTHNPTFFGRVKDRLRYAAGIYMIIDLISVIPIIFPFVIPGNYTLLHVFRLLSIFKLVRYTRHSDALQLLQRVVFKKREIISFLVIFLVFEILFASTIMYLVENAAQPDKFSSIPAAMWWAVMTVTTVGWGYYSYHTLGKDYRRDGNDRGCITPRPPFGNPCFGVYGRAAEGTGKPQSLRDRNRDFPA